MNPPSPKSPIAPVKGLKVWQLALTILAVALILRVSLGALPAQGPAPADPSPAVQQVAEHNASPTDADPDAPRRDLLAVEVLPFDLKGEMPGPLLTSILQRYLPNSTPDHADALRDTLPPGQDPRMIVIIPDEGEGKMF